MDEIENQILDSKLKTQDAVKGVESYVLADVDPDFTYKNPSVADAIKFNLDEIKVSPKISKVASKSEAANDILIKNKSERDLWDRSVRVWDAFSTGVSEQSRLQDELSELGFKKMQSNDPTVIGASEFTSKDMARMIELDDKIKSLPQYDENLTETLASSVGTSIGTMINNTFSPAVVTTTATGASMGAAVGGPIAPLTAIAGALKGYGVGIAYKYYKQTAGNSYLELKKSNPIFTGSPFSYPLKDSTEPFQLDLYDNDTRHRYVSHGVGAVSGALEVLITKGVGKTIPWINNLMKGKDIAKLPAKEITKLGLLGKYALQHGENGVTEVAQEMVEVAGQAIGNKGISNFTLSDVLSDDAMERYGLAFSAGAISSVGLQGAGIATGKTVKGGYTALRNLGERGSVGSDINNNQPKFTPKANPNDTAKAIRFKLQENAAKESLDAVKSSVVKTQSEAAYNELLDQVHDETVYLQNDKVQDMMKNDQVLANQIQNKHNIKIDPNAEITVISRSKAYQLAADNEKFFDAIQYEEDGPIKSEVDSYLEKFEKNKQKAQELEAKIDTVNDPEKSKEIINQLADLEEIRFDGYSSVEDYVNQPVLPASIVKNDPTGKLLKLESDVREVRQKVAEAEITIEKNKLRKMVKLDVEVQVEQELENLQADFKNYKVYDTIDAFMNPSISRTEFDTILNKEGTSKYAINPETLPEEIKHYVKDKQLKKFKVFDSNTGIDAEESAQLLGYDSVKSMLDDMRLAEPKQELVNDLIETETERLKPISEREIGWKGQEDIERVLNDLERQAKMHFREIKVLMQNYRSTIKEGIRQVALPDMTKIEDLKIKAIQIASSLKVKDLNAKMFSTNAIRADRKAVAAFNKGDIRSSLEFKEKAALNRLIQAEVVKINNNLNRDIKRLAKVISNDTKTISKAGKIYEEAFRTIVDVINFDRKFDQNAQLKWYTWASNINETERAKYDLPNELKGNDKQSVNDMSSQSAYALVKTAISIANEAKRKNKLVVKRDNLLELISLEQIAQQSKQISQSRKDYKFGAFENRNVRQDKSEVEKTIQSFSSLDASLIRVEEPIFRSKLDMGKNNGFWTNLLFKPLNAARNFHANTMLNIKSFVFDTMIKDYGNEKFYNLGYTVIDDPDTKEILKKKFGTSKITKLDLFAILLNRGNEGNVKALEQTFGRPIDEIHAVLEKHLTMDEIKLAQQHSIVFNNLFEDSVKAAKERGDDPPTRVEVQDFTFKGETVKGYYYPIIIEYDVAKSDRLALKGITEENKELRFRADILTANGHIIERDKLAKNNLNLDYSGFMRTVDQIAYDNAFRNTLSDTGKLIGYGGDDLGGNTEVQNSIQRDLYNILGESDYGVLIEWVKSLNERNSNEENRIRSEESSKVEKYIRAKVQAALGFNPTTMIIQFTSIPMVWTRFQEDYNGNIVAGFGDVSQNYTRTLTDMFTNSFDSNKNVMNEIAKYNPDFANRLKQLDISTDKIGVPDTGNKLWNQTKQATQDAAFFALNQISIRMNAATWITANNLAMEGKIKGVTKGDSKAAIEYANHVLRVELEANDTIDKSDIQRSRGAMVRLFTMFYSQMNVIYNKFAATGRLVKVKWTNDEKAQAMGLLATRFVMLAIVPAILEETIRAWFRDKKEKEKERKPEDYLKEGAYQILSSVPFARDMVYAIDKGSKRSPTIGFYEDAFNLYLSTKGVINYIQNYDTKTVKGAMGGKQGVRAFWQSAYLAGGAVGVPIKASKMLYDFSQGDFVEGVFNSDTYNIINDVLTNSISDLNVSIEDIKNTIKDETNEAIQQESDPEKKELLDQLKSTVEPKDVFDSPEGNTITLNELKADGTVGPMGDGKVSLSDREMSIIKTYNRLLRSGLESPNDPNAENPKPPYAKGYYQHIASTWSSITKLYPELGLNPSVPLPKNFDTEREKQIAIRQQNAAQWKLTAELLYKNRNNGIPMNFTTMYISHMLEIGEAQKLLKAEGSKKVKDVLSKKGLNALKNNAIAALDSGSLDLSTATVKQVKESYKKYITKGINKLAKEEPNKEDQAYVITKLTEQL